nr:hypothetical protein CR513_19698 [Ipomoea batatas]
MAEEDAIVKIGIYTINHYQKMGLEAADEPGHDLLPIPKGNSLVDSTSPPSNLSGLKLVGSSHSLGSLYLSLGRSSSSIARSCPTRLSISALALSNTSGWLSKMDIAHSIVTAETKVPFSRSHPQYDVKRQFGKLRFQLNCPKPISRGLDQFLQQNLDFVLPDGLKRVETTGGEDLQRANAAEVAPVIAVGGAGQGSVVVGQTFQKLRGRQE